MMTHRKNSQFHKFIGAIDSFPISNTKSAYYDVDVIISPKQVRNLKNLLGETQYANILELGRQAQDGVNLCKKGNVEEGYLKMLDAHSKASTLSEMGFQYFHIYYLSCIAYYYFKQRNFEKALSYSWQEIEEIEEFETVTGIDTLHYRRAGGRILNIVKVLFVSGQSDSAIKLLLGIFLYALNGDSSLLAKANWNQNKLNIYPYVRQRYVDIIFQQIIENEILFQHNNDSYFYEYIYRRIPEFEVNDGSRLVLYNWLKLREYYHEGLYKSFIKGTIAFCKTPLDMTFDILKLSLISKMILLIKQHESAMIKEIGELIKNYIVRLRVNPNLKEKVLQSI